MHKQTLKSIYFDFEVLQAKHQQLLLKKIMLNLTEAKFVLCFTHLPFKVAGTHLYVSMAVFMDQNCCFLLNQLEMQVI